MCKGSLPLQLLIPQQCDFCATCNVGLVYSPHTTASPSPRLPTALRKCCNVLVADWNCELVEVQSPAGRRPVMGKSFMRSMIHLSITSAPHVAENWNTHESSTPEKKKMNGRNLDKNYSRHSSQEPPKEKPNSLAAERQELRQSIEYNRCSLLVRQTTFYLHCLMV